MERNAEFFRFAKLMIAFRKAHPSLARSRFWRDDASWYGPHAPVDFDSQTIGVYLAGASQGDDDIYMLINAAPDPVAFEVPAAGLWLRVIDTALASPHDIAAEGEGEPVRVPAYLMQGRSVVVLIKSTL